MFSSPISFPRSCFLALVASPLSLPIPCEPSPTCLAVTGPEPILCGYLADPGPVLSVKTIPKARAAPQPSCNADGESTSHRPDCLS